MIEFPKKLIIFPVFISTFPTWVSLLWMSLRRGWEWLLLAWLGCWAGSGGRLNLVSPTPLRRKGRLSGLSTFTSTFVTNNLQHTYLQGMDLFCFGVIRFGGLLYLILYHLTEGFPCHWQRLFLRIMVVSIFLPLFWAIVLTKNHVLSKIVQMCFIHANVMFGWHGTNERTSRQLSACYSGPMPSVLPWPWLPGDMSSPGASYWLHLTLTSLLIGPGCID